MTAGGISEWEDIDGDGTATPTISSGGSFGTATAVTEAQVTNLVSDLALKAPLASPTFTGTVTLPVATVGSTQAGSDSSTKLATTAYVSSVQRPNIWTANNAFARPTANETGVATVALKPILYPIDPSGRRTFSLNSLLMKVTTLAASSTIGAAIYSWSLSGSTFTLTLVATIGSSIDSSTVGNKLQAVSGAPVTLDFTSNLYYAAGMASTTTTLQIVGGTHVGGVGGVAYTGSARSSVTDFPTTIDNNASGQNNAAGFGSTTYRTPWIGLSDSAGTSWP